MSVPLSSPELITRVLDRLFARGLKSGKWRDTARALCRAMVVSRLWCTCATNSQLWKVLVHSRWPSTQQLTSIVPHPIDFRKLCRSRALEVVPLVAHTHDLGVEQYILLVEVTTGLRGARTVVGSCAVRMDSRATNLDTQAQKKKATLNISVAGKT